MTPIGPSVGTSAANWRLTPRTSLRNCRQPGQSRMCRRASPLGADAAVVGDDQVLADPAQAVSRASLAWASPTRARTSSDLTAGTDTPSAPATSA